MGIKFREDIQGHEVKVSKRHPVTRQPRSLCRIRNDKGGLIKTKSEAQRIYNELILQLEKSFEVREGKVLYAELLKRFYKSLEERDLSKATIENYRLCLDAHTLSLWRHREIDTILPEEIRQLIRVRLGERSRSHQKSMLKFIRGVFNYAHEAGLLSRSPVPFMQFRIGNKFKPVLNETQARMLLEKAKLYEHEWYLHWAVALFTGLRNGEQYALTWENVDLENRLIFVRRVWTKKDGFKDLTKSGDDRVVEIALPLAMMLREMRVKAAESPFVLPRIDAWDEGRQAEFLRIFLVGVGLPQISYHNLRATWATLLLAKGVEPVKVMKMGGWSSLKTLEQHYIRLSGIDVKGATDSLQFHDPLMRDGKLLGTSMCSDS